jgi:hypothetical protein
MCRLCSPLTACFARHWRYPSRPAKPAPGARLVLIDEPGMLMRAVDQSGLPILARLDDVAEQNQQPGIGEQAGRRR